MIDGYYPKSFVTIDRFNGHISRAIIGMIINKDKVNAVAWIIQLPEVVDKQWKVSLFISERNDNRDLSIGRGLQLALVVEQCPAPCKHENQHRVKSKYNRQKDQHARLCRKLLG